MKEAVLVSAKISCGHCKMTVESTGNSLEGVSSISADPETKKIDVTYDENVITLDEIKQAMEKAGYPTD
ncbi:MAG: heavy-metal-associated domain-containing protein [Actinobacteria bacterium]|nr:heavy-metal-associated domain-containing protein [Actinomycetota bacterium]